MTKQRAVGIRETALFWTNKTEAFQSLGRAVRNDSTSRCNSLFFCACRLCVGADSYDMDKNRRPAERSDPAGNR